MAYAIKKCQCASPDCEGRCPCKCGEGATTNPIRYTNGEILMSVSDLSISGFGLAWGHTRMYDNRLGSNGQRNHDFRNGHNWMVREQAYLVDRYQNYDAIVVMISPSEAYWFVKDDDHYDGQYGTHATLEHDTDTHIFKFTQSDGTIWEFYDADQTVSTKPNLALFKVTTPGGQVLDLTYNGRGELTTVKRSMGSGASYREDKFAYTYFSGFGEEGPHANAGHVKQITYSRKVSSTTTELRQVKYTYYDGESESDNGLMDDLRTVEHLVKDGTWKTTAKYYYRYYTDSEGTGFEHGLKHVVGPEAYKRIEDRSAPSSNNDPIEVEDSLLDDYADMKFEYDSQRRVNKEHVAGGSRTYEYDYTVSAHSDAPNHWKIKTVEDLPDGTINTVYTNHLGQIMLKERKKDSDKWIEYRKYDENYRLEERAEPSAIENAPNDANADLIPGGGLLYDSQGLIHVTEYYSDPLGMGETAATSAIAGGVPGLVKFQKIKNGNTATPIKLSELKYFERTADGTTIYPVAEEIVYQSDTGGGDPVTTKFSYTWHASTTQIKERTTTLPKIEADHNGPGVGVNDPEFTRIEEYDTFGKMIRETDARGSISLFEYDDSLGTLTKQTDNQGMLGHWKLDDGQGVAPSDSSGFGNAGTLGGSPTSTTGPSGDANTALDFDGLTQYADLGKPDVLDVQPTDPFTLAAWIKVGADESGCILAKADDSNVQYKLHLDTGKLKGMVGGGTEINSNTDVDDNQWYHVALVNYDSGSGTMKGQLYVDGVKKHTAINSSTNTADRDVLVAARRTNADGATEYLDGTVADVRIYNRALSVEEIGRLHDLSPGTNERVTENEIDDEGRVTQTLGPWHNINGSLVRTATWTVYDDENHEVRTARGYQDSTEDPTLVNPVSITKFDEDGRVTDQIQATKGTAVEHTEKLVAGDAFTDQNNWTRWTKNKYELDSGGRYTGNLTSTRVYHTIPDSVTPDEGSSGTNYDETTFGYDDMNRQDRVETPGGTITRTVFEARGLVESIWVGTDDTPDAGEWAPDNTTDTNLVPITEYTYDINGNQTEVEQHVDDSNSRVTTYAYDWRNRHEQTTNPADESGRVTYTLNDFDNVGRITKTEQYHQTTPSDLLIARSETNYDDQGRAYQTIRHEVNPTTAVVGDHLTDNVWYDCCGSQIKSHPGGSEAFTKTVYDGHGRAIVTYAGFDTGDTLYAHATDVEGDKIFEQSATDYDEAGNMTTTAHLRRYHDATSTGALVAGTDARPSYSATWQDALGRGVATAAYGNQGGDSTAFTRPAAIPTGTATLLVTSTTYNADGEAYKTTDPAGKISENTLDDAGRVTKTIDNLIAGTADDKNVTVETAYNSDGNVATLKATNSTTGDQTTTYVYGTDKPNITPEIYHNGLLRAVIYPESDDPSSLSNDGADTIYDRVEYKYNRQSEIIEMKDQNETVHTYEYDDLGRLIEDKVVPGTGVDGAVKRIATTYEVRGLVEKVTSHTEVSAGSVVNDVKWEYNDLGLLITEHQDHDSIVGTSPKVQYAYDGTADGNKELTKGLRPTKVTYPDGRILRYEYNSGDDDNLNRISYLADDASGNVGTHLAEYTYLGLGSFLKVNYPEPASFDVHYNLATGSGHAYDGLDRFDRVVDLLWEKHSGSTGDLVRIKHGYDQIGNRKYREDDAAAGQSVHLDELYTYDGVNRLKDFDRGNLNGTKNGLTTLDFAQEWALDPTGNWKTFKQDDDGDTIWNLNQSRTHTKANEIDTIDSSTTHVSHDGAGNMTKAPKPSSWSAHYDLTYDAWNRLVKVEDASSTVAEYAYDGTGRRTLKKVYVSGSPDHTQHFYYSANWQVLEERVDSSTDADRQFVWGPRYVDDLILRDRDTTEPPNGTLNERLYAMQDANWNVVALADITGTVQERYVYGAYGEPLVRNDDFTNKSTGSGYDWEYHFTGRRLDDESGMYYNRARYYDPQLGRFLWRDPIGYEDGWNLYEYASDNPLVFTDACGLAEKKCLVFQGAGTGSIAAEVSLAGKTLTRISGESFYISTSQPPGTWSPKNSTTALFVYKKSNPNKMYRLDYHSLPTGSKGPGVWHHNQKGVYKYKGLQAINHSVTPSATFSGRTLTVFRWGGRGVFIVSAAMGAVDIYNAENRERQVVSTVGGLAGGFAGGWAGAKGGASIGAGGAAVVGQLGPQVCTPEELVTVPAGAIVGGFVGGIVGGVGGSILGCKVAETVYDWIFTPLEKEEWQVCEEVPSSTGYTPGSIGYDAIFGHLGL